MLTLFSWNLQSDIWELIAGYSEKGKILRQKLEGTLPRNFIVMYECISQSYKFLFRDEFIIIVFLISTLGYFLVQ